jgi:hypothetical protein
VLHKLLNPDDSHELAGISELPLAKAKIKIIDMAWLSTCTHRVQVDWLASTASNKNEQTPLSFERASAQLRLLASPYWSSST